MASKPRIDRDTLAATLTDAGRPARLDALAAYLAALPVATASHWDMLTCMLHDLASVRDRVYPPTLTESS